MSLFLSWVRRAWLYARAHKIFSFLLLIVVLGLGWFVWGRAHAATAATRYVVGEASIGTVVASISASGQISAENQVELKPKASGDITYVGIKPGQTVKAGQLLVRLDSGDSGYELQSAQLSYQQLVTVDPQDLRDAKSAVTSAEDSETDAYASAAATLSSSLTDMTDTLESLNTLYGNGGYLSTRGGLSSGESASRKQAQDAWYVADTALSDYTKYYRALPANATQAQLEAALAQAASVAQKVAAAAKYAQDAVILLRNQAEGNATEANSAYTTASGLVSDANGEVSSVSSSQSSIASAKRALTKAQGDLEELQAGPSELDRRSAALSVSQKQEALSDYSVYAPFAGMVASVDAKVGAQGSSGTAVATLITKAQVADISLNEVDAAKVKAGQKATLTFDAIDGLTLTGTVAEVDQVGTVSSGVVSYGVQIALDAQDDRIKPGMTVNATIQTDTAQDVLVVPASAVKTSGGQSYVLAFETPVATSSQAASGITSSEAPLQIPVEVGIADDTSVEIISGLSEGEQIITRTIAASSATTATASRTAAGGTTGARAGGAAGATFRAF